MATLKNQLREEISARRRAMSPFVREQVAGDLADWMYAAPFRLEYDVTVAAYVPVGTEPGSPAMLDALIDRAVASGQLIHRRGAFLRAEAGEAGSDRAIIRPHGQDATTAIDAARIIDCRGIRNDPERHATPLVAGLLADAAARLQYQAAKGDALTAEVNLYKALGGGWTEYQAPAPAPAAAN